MKAYIQFAGRWDSQEALVAILKELSKKDKRIDMDSLGKSGNEVMFTKSVGEAREILKMVSNYFKVRDKKHLHLENRLVYEGCEMKALIRSI